jgi:hypothetical protein
MIYTLSVNALEILITIISGSKSFVPEKIIHCKGITLIIIFSSQLRYLFRSCLYTQFFKNAWKVDDQRLMFVLKIWVYRHDLNKYLSWDENIIINLIPLQWIIFSGTKLLEPEIMVIKISRAFTDKV